MKSRKVLPSEIIGVYEKELHVGSSIIIVKTKTTTHLLSPLSFRKRIADKMNYVTTDHLFEFEYDVLMYINDMMNNNK